MKDAHAALFGLQLERALRLAAVAHAGQVRRSSQVPYVEHAMAVAWILDRAGFEDHVVIAGLLHDLLEDTSVTAGELEEQFNPLVARLVEHCSERKLDDAGFKRPWVDRKNDHIACIATSPVEARAIVLADKLHNLLSIELDLSEGRPAWGEFHADRESVLRYHRSMIEACTRSPEDPRLDQLADSVLRALERVEAVGP